MTKVKMLSKLEMRNRENEMIKVFSAKALKFDTDVNIRLLEDNYGPTSHRQD